MPPKYASRWQNLGSNSGNMKEYRVVKSDILEYNGGKWKDITLVERPNLDGTIGTKVTSGLAYKGNTVFDRNPEINAVVNATVLGIGTNEPFSRISLGSNKGDGTFDNAKTMGGQNAAIALHENSDGRDFKGFVYDQQVESQNQPTNELMLTNALGIFSNASTTNFSLLDHNILENEDGSLLNREKLGGRLYLTEDDRVIIGGKPRVGLESGSELLTEYDEIKVKLDVRGSIRTQGYINFLNYSSNDPLSNPGGYDGWLRDVDNKANFASRNNDPTSPNVENIPRGSIWLGLDRDFIPDENTTISSNQPNLYFKDSNGSIRKIQTQDDGDKLFSGKIASINDEQTFGFIFNESTENTLPVRITLSGERFNVDLETETDPQYFKNALTIRTGNVAITGIHGSNNEVKTSLDQETQIKPYFLKNDLIGGKFWVERQQGIGPNQHDKLYSMLNIETLEKIPTLVSCKTWNTYTYEKASFKELGESLIIEIEFEIPLDADGNPDLTVDKLANKFLDIGLKVEINTISDNGITRLIEGIHFISEISQTNPTFQYKLTAEKVLVIEDGVNITDDEDYFFIPIERENVNGALIFQYNQYDIINLLGVLPDDLRSGIHYVAEIDTDNDTIKILKNYEDFDFTIDEEKRKIKIFDFNFNPPDATNSIILVDETEKNFSELSSTIDNINARNCFMFGSIHDVNIKNSIIGGTVKNTVEGEGDCLILGGGNIVANANNLAVIGNNNQVPDRLFSDLRLVVGDDNSVFYVDSNANASVGGNLDVLGVAERDGGKGNLDVRGDGLIRQNLTVNGDLTVKGTTTTLDTVNTTIEDNIIELARNTTNPASAKDSGILIQRGGNNAFMGFCEQEGKFTMCMTDADGNFNGNYISKEDATLNVFELEFSNAEGTKLSIQDKITSPSQYYLTVNKNSNGYVGIGMNDPKEQLSVKKKIAFQQSVGDNAFTDCGMSLYFSGEPDTERKFLFFDSSGNLILRATDYDPVDGIKLQSADGTDRLFVRNDGNIGIGIDDPKYMLHLQSKKGVVLRMEADKDNDITTEDYNPMIWMTQDGMTANNDYFKIGMGGEDDSIFPDFKKNSGFLHAGHKFQIATGHPGAARLTIDETGNLGIGSNEPKSKLYIEDKTVNNTFLTIVGKAGENTGIKLARGLGNKKGPKLTASDDDNNNFTIQLSDQGLNFGVSDSLENNGSSDKFLILNNDKKVGIGTLEPARELTVKCGSNSGVVGIGDKLNGEAGGKRPGIYFAKDSDALNDMSYPNIYTFRPNEEGQQLYYKHNEHLFYVNNDFKDGTTTQTHTDEWNDGIQKFGLGVFKYGNVGIGSIDIPDDNTKLQIFTDSTVPSTDFSSSQIEKNILNVEAKQGNSVVTYGIFEHLSTSAISVDDVVKIDGSKYTVIDRSIAGRIGLDKGITSADGTYELILFSDRQGWNECLRLTGSSNDDGGAFIRFTNKLRRSAGFSFDTSKYNKYTGGGGAPEVNGFFTYNIAGIHGYDPNCDCFTGNLGFFTAGLDPLDRVGGAQLTESMTIQGKTGNVGIGITDPITSLVVCEKTRGGIIAFGDKDVITRNIDGTPVVNTDGTPVISTDQRPGIYFAKDSEALSNTVYPNIYVKNPNTDISSMRFVEKSHNFTSTSADKYFMRINETGVSIGTDLTADVSLDINGTDAIKVPSGNTAQRPLTNPTTKLPSKVGLIRYNSEVNQYEVTIKNSDNTQLEWVALSTGGGGGGDGTQAITVDENGNVGIGTAMDDDDTKLQIFTKSSATSTDFFYPDGGCNEVTSESCTIKNECLRLTGWNRNNGGAFIRFTNNIERGGGGGWPTIPDSRYNKYTGGKSAPAVGGIFSYNIAGIHGYDPNCDCFSGNLGFFTAVGSKKDGAPPTDGDLGSQLTESMTIQGETGNVGIGITEPIVSLDVKGTDAIRLPVGNTDQRPKFSDADDNPLAVSGLIRYNSQINQYEVSFGTSWSKLAIDDTTGGSLASAFASIKSTADTAKSTADTAKSTADTAKSTADTAMSAFGTGGRIFKIERNIGARQGADDDGSLEDLHNYSTGSNTLVKSINATHSVLTNADTALSDRLDTLEAAATATTGYTGSGSYTITAGKIIFATDPPDHPKFGVAPQFPQGTIWLEMQAASFNRKIWVQTGPGDSNDWEQFV